MRPLDICLGLVIILVWGFNFVVIAWGLEELPPLFMGGLRFLAVALVGSLLVRRPDTPWKWMLLYGLSLGFGQFALLFSAMAVGMSAGLASLVLQSQALFTLLFARWILHEAMHLHQFLALLVAGAGLSLVGLSQEGASMTALGFGLTLAAASSWALGNIVNRQIAQKGYKGGLSLVVWSAWIPPLPFFLCSYLFEADFSLQLVLDMSALSWFAVIYLALIATVLGYGLWGRLLSRYPAAQVSPLTLGVPVVGLSCAALLLGEELQPLQWGGIVLVLLGLGLNTWGAPLLSRWRTAA
ncbi:EamA family transporter [Neptuniibacter halophilus]|uniref:EamA family transporter n=1 Tax=Neptuniibacter halophilus TaxID=651666 RepID=UPI002573E312|nr:EamA family transporter [Neptuniibacter halophilus]